MSLLSSLSTGYVSPCQLCFPLLEAPDTHLTVTSCLPFYPALLVPGPLMGPFSFTGILVTYEVAELESSTQQG